MDLGQKCQYVGQVIRKSVNSLSALLAVDSKGLNVVDSK